MEVWKDIGAKVKEIAGSWTYYAALGSFTLYLMGYLSLRFHLTVIGIGTDMAILDERYLFAGAKFLVHFVTTIPSLILLILALAILIYFPYRLLPEGIRARLRISVVSLLEKVWAWCSVSNRLVLTGIFFAVLMIQLVMRQCFFFSNLLLAEHLPEPAWLSSLFLDRSGLVEIYFIGLVAATAVTAGIFLVVRSREVKSSFSHFLSGLLVFLACVQILLLPVNYGIFIADKDVPVVSQDFGEGQEAWLVWEGKEGVTFLVRSVKDGKRLVTLLRNDVKEIKILRYDSIFDVLFSRRQ